MQLMGKYSASVAPVSLGLWACHSDCSADTRHAGAFEVFVAEFQPNPSERCELVPVRMARSGGPMKDKDKLVTLIRLRDMVYFGVRPTLRQCGFPPEIVQELVKEGMIQLGDKKFGDDSDRYVIEEILPAGLSFILKQRACRNR
jgi:hypothetical protein